MKTFNRMAAQGDCMLIRVNDIPEGLVPVNPENDVYVIAHSETGHNHVMERTNMEVYKDPSKNEVDLYEMFMVVKEPTELKHLRNFDTHESLLVPPGNYKVVRQREYTPEGFRKAAD